MDFVFEDSVRTHLRPGVPEELPGATLSPHWSSLRDSPLGGPVGTARNCLAVTVWPPINKELIGEVGSCRTCSRVEDERNLQGLAPGGPLTGSLGQKASR